MRNRRVTSVADAPAVPVGTIRANDFLDDNSFWPLLDGLRSAHNDFTALMKLRRRLSQMSIDNVLSFQSSFVHKLSQMHDAVPRLRWADLAWQLVVDGREAYQRALLREPSRERGVSAWDALEVAEWVVGKRIEFPGSDTIRSDDRDVEYWSEQFHQHRLLKSTAVEPLPENTRRWWLRPHRDPVVRWYGWRAVIEREDGARSEVVLFGSRRYGESLALVADRARAQLHGQGRLISSLEMEDPESGGVQVRGLGAYVPAAYWITGRGTKSLDDLRTLYL